ncbi:uracil-DNA glycosylase-like protein [Piptocephalis cylindrospora]|uniref:Uracil-DNA glycosylase n=1 Tax=Piptocephalis cylindrospora TaxID=1907219 RepID=A0A4P9Y858_9FUNG|nr:uracil-DNA glycosylase-like protein [Piptocephalis cylindrospora]|eukprot:RKP14964.1 uracil-DNA glycosylase-like protein [Piptocephalis cylindrospora]
MSSQPLTNFFTVKRKAETSSSAPSDVAQKDAVASSLKPSKSSQDNQEPTAAVIESKTENNENDGERVKRLRVEDFTVSENLKVSNLEIGSMHPTWYRALSAEFRKPYFAKLKAFLTKEYQGQQKIFPPLVDVYSWSRFTHFDEVRVVILGQDPYHNHNQAHGLCFSVRKGIPPPPSLVNMYKELTLEDPSFSPPKHGYLGGWASQGVLMLNTTLTVRAHQAASHAGQGWENLTDAVIETVNKRKRNVVFILWGAHAQKKGRGIDKKKHLILQGPHPSPLSAHRGFFNCGHFAKANDYLESKGLPLVDWANLPEELDRS